MPSRENPSPSSYTTSDYSAQESSSASNVPPSDITDISQISIDDTTNITSLKPLSEYKLSCFMGEADISPAYPEPSDCISALTLLLHGDKPDAPIVFAANFGFTVPHRWVWHTCVLIVQVNAGQVVTSTFQRIANAAQIILKHCLDTDLDYRGGLLRVGEMLISINGRDFVSGMRKWKSEIGSQGYYDGVWGQLKGIGTVSL